MNNDWQTIISVGVEGGSITLLGRELQPGEWVFKKSINEINLFDGEDETILSPQPTREVRTLKYPLPDPDEVDSWDRALQLLDRYPWPRLNPHKVHPAFRKKVWGALQKIGKQRKENTFDTFQFNRWVRLCFPGYSIEKVVLSTWLQNSKYTTILTGAGMSTESNIPDFRSKEGWWKNIDPRTVATTEALRNRYDLFHEFYSMRIKGLENCSPHKGHEVLASWEQKGLIQAIATQNVDGFHTAAGSRHVYELHGSIHKFRCDNCSFSSSKELFLTKVACSHCGGKLRTGIVLFGESLPETNWNSSLEHIRKSELVIVIGTSLEVFPASSLPQMTDGRTVYINYEMNDNRPKFDLVIKGKAGEVLQQLEEIL
ncbi:SIR2 family NAD-dependent protein deacylase [Pseudoneobacillus rhizosphaerae]|uniref:protein acetyllysine N-acetyltransferase n=1 Tax=Pseudoneobacillus rhizosphaerae TaxID=2880968 RepID=A0A9C7G6Y1_9BACI|nr:NAD-dependent protein deacetylase [Pseudoneobacillus rhizosphaerae]